MSTRKEKNSKLFREILANKLSSSKSNRIWLNVMRCYVNMERDKRREVLNENRKKRHKKIKPDDEQVKEFLLNNQIINGA